MVDSSTKKTWKWGQWWLVQYHVFTSALAPKASKSCASCPQFYIQFRAAMAAKDVKDWSLPSFGSHLNPISTRGGQIMPILYWGPWLAKINRGGPEYYVLYYSNYSLLSKISTCKIQLNKTFFVACLLDLSNKIYF